MPRRDDETIELAARAIAEANEKHLRGTPGIALLIVLFVGGLGLLIAGARAKALGVPGSWRPIAVHDDLALAADRQVAQDNPDLQVVLQLLKLATSKKSKLLAAELVRKLIEQV